MITVLKVLAGHPGGRASIGDLKRAVAILMCSGPDWNERTKRLAARAPGLDIFSQGYIKGVRQEKKATKKKKAPKR
jgi:hypothetical protein